MLRDDTIKRRLGYNVTLHRQRRGWTQAYLAEEVQISPTFLLHIERGTRGVSLETIEALAHALEVDVSELFTMPIGLDLTPAERSSLRNCFEKDLLEHVGKAITEVLDRYKAGI